MTALCTRCSGRSWQWEPARELGPGGRRKLPCPACRGTGRTSATNRGTSSAAAQDAVLEELVRIHGTPEFARCTDVERETVRLWMLEHRDHPAVVAAFRRAFEAVDDPAVSVADMLAIVLGLPAPPPKSPHRTDPRR